MLAAYTIYPVTGTCRTRPVTGIGPVLGVTPVQAVSGSKTVDQMKTVQIFSRGAANQAARASRWAPGYMPDEAAASYIAVTERIPMTARVTDLTIDNLSPLLLAYRAVDAGAWERDIVSKYADRLRAGRHSG